MNRTPTSSEVALVPLRSPTKVATLSAANRISLLGVDPVISTAKSADSSATGVTSVTEPATLDTAGATLKVRGIPPTFNVLLMAAPVVFRSADSVPLSERSETPTMLAEPLAEKAYVPSAAMRATTDPLLKRTPISSAVLEVPFLSPAKPAALATPIRISRVGALPVASTVKSPESSAIGVSSVRLP